MSVWWWSRAAVAEMSAPELAVEESVRSLA
jgi:hypothetical protein